jgi:hypothetical protein
LAWALPQAFFTRGDTRGYCRGQKMSAAMPADTVFVNVHVSSRMYCRGHFLPAGIAAGNTSVVCRQLNRKLIDKDKMLPQG